MRTEATSQFAWCTSIDTVHLYCWINATCLQTTDSVLLHTKSGDDLARQYLAAWIRLHLHCMQNIKDDTQSRGPLPVIHQMMREDGLEHLEHTVHLMTCMKIDNPFQRANLYLRIEDICKRWDPLAHACPQDLPAQIHKYLAYIYDPIELLQNIHSNGKKDWTWGPLCWCFLPYQSSVIMVFAEQIWVKRLKLILIKVKPFTHYRFVAGTWPSS